MNKEVENMNGNDSMAILDKLSKNNGFKLPSNYFEELEEKIHNLIVLDNLISESKGSFTVPDDDYFTTSKEQILCKAKLTTLIANKNNFKTPDKYFDKLENKITAKVNNQTKVRRLWFKPLFKYASAASITLIIGGYWLLSQQIKTHQQSKIDLVQEQTLYEIDEATIANYLQDEQSTSKEPNQAELEEYILNNYSTYEISRNL